MSRTTIAGSICLLLIGGAVQAADGFPHWRSLFDGKTTDGWTQAKQKGSWQVDGGALTQKDMVDYCTTDAFGNYELELEFRSEPTGDGNSGVYLRGQIEVQIFNATDKVKDVKDLQAFHGGGIYGSKPPLANPHHKQGEWNQYRILHVGNAISVWINDVLVQDQVVVDQATPGAISKMPGTEKPLTIDRGPIMLQGDHNKMWFRNIRIRELPDGWVPLWNNVDFSEMTTHSDQPTAKNWTVDGIAFTNVFGPAREQRGHRDLWTKKGYGNFLVHYEYRSDPGDEGGNSGFYLRDQWEIQILSAESTTEPHSDGAFYSVKAKSVLASNGPGKWNEMDVKLVGDKAWVWQNGKLIHDGVELTFRTDNNSVKTDKFSRKPFKFQGDHGRVWFRELYIKELPDGE